MPPALTPEELETVGIARKQLADLTDHQTLALYTYVSSMGWLESLTKRTSKNHEGKPIPWITYSAIRFLMKHLPKEPRVFEFGSGFSTLWWAARASHLMTVEHNKKWFDKISKNLPKNVDYRFVELEPDGQYCRTAAESGLTFDVIVVDGRDRVNCIKYSLPVLSETGVVILDNSNRDRYAPGLELLSRAGFRQIEFISHGAINPKPWHTSMFFRPLQNCLGLQP